MKLKSIALLMAFVFSAGFISAKDSVTEKSKMESVIQKDALSTSQVKIEVKEHYKIDSAEYIGAIASNGEVHSYILIGAFIGIIALLFGRLKELFTVKRLALPVLVGVAIIADYLDEGSKMSLAILPIIPFMRDPDGGSGGGSNENPELKAIRQVGEQVKSFKETLGAKADKTEIKAISDSLEAMRANVDSISKEKLGEQLSAIKTQLKEMAEDVAIVKDGRKGSNVSKTFGEQVVELLKTNKITSETFKSNGRAHEVYHISGRVDKASATMTTSNVASVGTSPAFSLTSYEPGVTRIPTRRPWLLDIANVSPTDKKFVQWAEQANRDGAANETAEGAAKNLIDFDWVEKSARVEKITAYIKVSKEALDDLDGLANEIDTELREMVMLKADADLLSGDGTTPTLNGLLNQDTAYSAGGFAATVITPNKGDVLRTAIAQVVKAFFMPNYVLMHPDDLASMDLDKGSDGHYVMPPFKSADGSIISGVKLIANVGQTVDNFTVGDFTKMNVRLREGLTIDIGHDADDFTKNLITILGEIRLVSYVKSNHQAAFVSGTFSAAIAALTKP